LDRCELLLGGEWEKPHSGIYDTAINPSNGSTVALFALGDKADTSKAIDIARDAFERGEWSRLSMEKRAAVLKKAAELMRERAERTSPALKGPMVEKR